MWPWAEVALRSLDRGTPMYNNPEELEAESALMVKVSEALIDAGEPAEVAAAAAEELAAILRESPAAASEPRGAQREPRLPPSAPMMRKVSSMNGNDGTLGGPLRNLARLRDVRSRRASSYDRTGGNDDFVWIAPGESARLLDAEGPGCITHIWMTIACEGAASSAQARAAHVVGRRGRRRASRCRSATSSAWATGRRATSSLPLPMSAAGRARRSTATSRCRSRGRARIEVENQGERRAAARSTSTSTTSSYDAARRRSRPLPRPVAAREPAATASRRRHGLRTTTSSAARTRRRGQLRDPRGRGPRPLRRLPPRHRQLAETRGRNWYGEGDDMIFIDGEPWPPSLHGTGTEDYFNTAWCPQEPTPPLPRHHHAGRPQLVRQDLALPLPHRGPDPLPQARSG